MMRRLMLFIGGALLGLAFGSTLTLLMTPASGKAMRKGAKSRLHEIVGEAREAAETRRQELEAELVSMIGKAPDSKTSTRR